MKAITIFDATGAVNRTVYCPIEMIVHQLQFGELFVDGVFDHDLHYLDISTGSVVVKPLRPAGDVIFDFLTHSWVPTPYTPAQLIDTALIKRAQLLAACDWSQLPDVPIATQLIWRAYRQALRDITLQPGYPQAIIWPVKPA